MITVAAEIGMAHDGDWTQVERYAKAAKACGVDVLKLQCHHPAESSPLEQWRVPPASGESRLDYWTRTAWDVATWRQVGQVIHDHGLKFGCSVFSLEAVALLTQVPELDVWKVPSGCAEWGELDWAVVTAAQNRPVWASCGLSNAEPSREHAVWLNCTSLYPCPPELSGLGWMQARVLSEYYHETDHPWGWSDHTGDPALIYAAIGAGAVVVEVHMELGHEATPDTSASWTPARLAELVAGIRRIELGLASTDKDAIAQAVAHLRKFYVPTRYNGRVAKWHGKGDPV